MMNPSADRLARTFCDVTLFIVGASALLAAGCVFIGSPPEAPPAIEILLEPGETVILDGQKMASLEEFRTILGPKADRIRMDRQWGLTHPGKLRGTLPVHDVIIAFPSPDQTTYEEFCRVLIECVRLGLESYEIAGVPVRFLRTSGPTAAGAAAEPPLVSFLPMDILKPADLDALAQHAAALNGFNVGIRSALDTPMSEVIPAMTALDACGARVCFCVPTVPEEGEARLVLEQARTPGIYQKIRYVQRPRPVAIPRPDLLPGRATSLARAGTDDPHISVLRVLESSEEPGSAEGAAVRRPGFFGVGAADGPGKIVYVLDRSGSMTDSMDYVKFEVKQAIGELGEANEFHVIFYSSGPPVEMPTRRLVEATERNKQLAFEFIDGVIPQGKTDPSKALERAFAVKPERIYLLTDGEFDRAIIDLVKRLNPDKQVAVHTIGFLYKLSEEVLKEVARENGGEYRFVSEKDLEALVH
ncbi:MAG TPA: VWA domain-containing protein [Phycisphaerae bacterium]|nr:VWA domain-containing protein [Phycisphaerae bacterium]